ncbi:unnamed protein product [Lymnaea stagnalis]|uniref:Biogenesis of lysosome-related organelles complex 1 subunit 4 n=1 Tax=Lymnaea stagnalis TaxID=6523 RepID=A0AAV2HSQ0_LYMST
MADPITNPVDLTLQSQSSVSSSVTDENERKSNKEITNEMATNFFKFLNFSVAKEENKFNDSVEMMLTKLDEFFSLVDMIRSDTSLCLTTTLPQIQDKCAQMEAIFDKIDKLEEFVGIVRECVALTEEKVAKAETDLGTVGGLVKKLTSLVSMKKTPVLASSKPKRPDFIPPKIYSTQDFFSHSQDDVPTAAAADFSAESTLDPS